jgi:uncharacterized protein YehS (DUF1456 family)
MINNNDILRRVRYAFDYKDPKMMEIFSLGDLQVTREQVSQWLKQDGDPEHKEITDTELGIFLNGLIVLLRGKKEGESPKPEDQLNNNIILRKLKIALNLKEEDTLEIMALANMRISKHELSALFRNPNQPQYRVCNDQFLRCFLQGLQLKYRTGS